MKIKFTLLIMCLFTLVANAQVLLDEPFDYTTGSFSTVPNWTTLNDGTHYITLGTGRNIVSPALTYSNSGGTWALSGLGKTVNTDYITGADYLAYRNTGTPITSGTIYLSFLFKAGVAQGQSNSEVMSIAKNTTSGPKVLVGKGVVSTSKYRFATSRGASSSVDYKWGTTEFADINEVIFIVVKYDFATLTSSLFLNPTIGSATEPTPEAIDAISATLRDTLTGVRFRCNGTSAAKFNVGGVRVSTAWADAVRSNIVLPRLSTPTLLAASSIGREGFTANWTPVDNAISYDVSVYKGASLISKTNASGQASESLAITGLTTATEYTYKVTAIADEINYIGSFSSASSEKVTTLGLQTPAVFEATLISDLGFTANWTPVANATGYDILVYEGTTLISTTPAVGQATASAAITGLILGTTYTYKVIAKGDGVIFLDSSPSASISVVTIDPRAPILTSPTVAAITSTGATIGGTVTSFGETAIIARGTVWGTNSNSTENAFADGGTDLASFSHLRTGMAPNTLYYFRAFATNSTSTGYSTSGKFSTLSQPPITAVATNINAAGFTANWKAPTNQGTEKFTYTLEVSADNTFATGVTSSPGISTLSKAVTGLNFSTNYYYRLLIVNASGNSAYSDVASVTTTAFANLPTVTSITTTGATLGGTVMANGTATPTARGTVWGISSGNTDNDLPEGGTTVGAFSQARVDMLPNTLYYYRAYATYDGVTGYSPEASFTTLSLIPAVADASNISETGFTATWLASVQGSEVLTYILQVSKDNTFATGVFTVSEISANTLSYEITGLVPNIKYYYRVCAKNASGTTAWSEIKLVTAAITGFSNLELGNSNFSYYPNPVAEILKFDYQLLENNNVQLVIYNLNGKLISTLLEADKQAIGTYSKSFDLSSLNNGIYFARFTVGASTKSFKVVIDK